MSSETARQLCCDATLTVIVTDGDGSPLDAGRSRRDPTRKQRLAVIARDRRCVGCGAPARRCQIHHVRWWSDHGPTDVANLCPLCPGCHTNVHHFGWAVTRHGNRYTARPSLDEPRHPT